MPKIIHTALIVLALATGGFAGGQPLTPLPLPSPPQGINLATQSHGTLPCASIPTLTGDVSSSGCIVDVTGLQTFPISSTAPTSGQVLTFDGTNWAPADAASGSFTAGGDLSGSSSSQTVVKLQNRSVSASAPNTNDVLTWGGSSWAPAAPASGSFAAGGDLSGSSSSQTVTGLQGRTVAATAPSNGQFLGWNGSTWVPSTPAGAGNVSTSGSPAAHQLALWASGTAIKAVAPSANSQCFMSDAGSFASIDPSFRTCPSAVTFAGDLSGTLTSQTVTRLQGRTVSAAVPATNQVLTWNGTSWLPATVATGTFTAGGDLSGTTTAQTVIRLQGRTLASTAPATNQFIGWSGSQWQPMTPTTAFTAGGDLSGTSSSQTVTGLRGHSVNLTGALTVGVLLFWDGTQFNVGLPGTIVNVQSGTSYTVVGTSAGSTGDLSKLVTFSNGSAIAVTLPACGSTGFGNGFMFWAKNRGAGTVTITPTTSTIDGASSLALTTGQKAMIACNTGDNKYYTF